MQHPSVPNVDAELDLQRYPPEVQRRLQDLQRELQDGDITVQGFQKKKLRIMESLVMDELRPPRNDATSSSSSIVGTSSSQESLPIAPLASQQTGAALKVMPSVGSISLADVDLDAYNVEQDSARRSTVAPMPAVPVYASTPRAAPGPGSYFLAPTSAGMVPVPAGSENDMRYVDQQQLPTRAREIAADVVDEGSQTSMRSFASIVAVLRFRAHTTPKSAAFTVLDGKGRESASITFEKLNSRAERVSQLLKEKARLPAGSHVALLYRRSEIIEFVVSLYGCFYAGMVAVPTVTHSVTLEDEFTEVLFVWESCNVQLVLTTEANYKSVGRDSQACGVRFPAALEWWKTNEFGSYHPKRKGVEELVAVNADDLAYVEYSKSQIRELKGVLMDHRAIMNICTVDKAVNEWRQSDVMLMTMEPRQQIGLLLGAFWGVFNGSHTVMFADGVGDQPGVWGTAATKYKASVALSDYGQLLDIVATHREHVPSRKHPIDLSTIKALLVPTLQPHVAFNDEVADVLQRFGLRGRHCVCPLLTLPEFAGLPLAVRERRENTSHTWWLSRAPLKTDRVELGATPAPGDERAAVAVEDCGFVLPEIVVAIVDSETRALLPPDTVGEIWVHAPSLMARGFWTLPRLTDQVFHAHPVLRTTNAAAAGEGHMRRTAAFAVPGGGGVVTVAADQRNFVRTGMYGFLVDPALGSAARGDWTDRRRLAITTLRKDRVSVRSPAEASLWEHFSASDLVETAMRRVPGILACCITTMRVQEDVLPVALVEPSGVGALRVSGTSGADGADVGRTGSGGAAAYRGSGAPSFSSARAGSVSLSSVAGLSAADTGAYANLAQELMRVLREVLGFRLYAITVCQPGTIPRLRHPDVPSTGFTSGFFGYVSDVVACAAAGSETGAGDNWRICNKRREALDVDLARQAWEFGQLTPLYVKLDVDNGLVTHLPQGRERDTVMQELDSVLLARRSGGAIGQISGEFKEILVLDNATLRDLDTFESVLHALVWRAQTTPEEAAFTLLDVRGREVKTLSFRKLLTKVQSLATYLDRKGLRAGEHVICMFTHGLDFLVSLYACFYLGLVVIPVPPPDTNRLKEDVPAFLALLDEFAVDHVLVSQAVEDVVKSKPVQSMIKAVRHRTAAAAATSDNTETNGAAEEAGRLPNLVNVTKAPKVGKTGAPADDPLYQRGAQRVAALAAAAQPGTGMLQTPPAVVLVQYSADMKRTCVRLSHRNLLMQCRQLAIHCQMLNSVLSDFVPPPPSMANLQGASGTTAAADDEHGAQPAGPTPSALAAAAATTRPLISCARSFNGLGFVYGALLGVYVGVVTLILPPLDFFMNPQVWFEMVHKYKVKDAMTTYPMLEHAMSVMRNVDYRSFSLHNLKNMMVVSEGRARPEIYDLLMKNLLANRLEDFAVATVYSPTVNALATSRAYLQSDVTRLTLDLRALRQGRVSILKEDRGTLLRRAANADTDTNHAAGADPFAAFGFDADGNPVAQTISLQDSGKVATNALVAVVNPETGRLCPPNQVGEIWVSSPSNIDGYYGATVGDQLANTERLHREQFGATLDGYFTTTMDGQTTPILFARTGDRGFLYPAPVNEEAAAVAAAAAAAQAGGLPSPVWAGDDAQGQQAAVTGWAAYTRSANPAAYELVLFVVGSVHDDFTVNGLRHYACDIELTLERCHRSIPPEGAVVFQADGGAVVAVVEILSETDVFNCVPVLVNAVLREHQFFLDTIVFLNEAMLAKSRLSEKQRLKVAAAYRLGKLPTVAVVHVRQRLG